jgi:hypothetical protein
VAEFRAHQPLPPCDGVVDRRAFLPGLARDRKVVHLGCVDEHLTLARAGTGDLLHQELHRVCASLLGVDISVDGLAALRSVVPGDYLHGDVERLDELVLPAAEVVIAAELIEHLGNPGLFLDGLHAYLTQTGAVAVVTTPNAYAWAATARFGLWAREATHPDHRLVYSPVTLDITLQRSGLQPVRRYAHAWHRGPGARARLLDAAERRLYRRRPWLAPGLVYLVEASPLEPHGAER